MKLVPVGLNSDGIKICKTSLTDISMYEKYEKESRGHAAAVARSIYRWYQEKMISAKHEYDVMVSGGICNPAVRNALKKTGLRFRVPDDPLYSNALGHYMRAQKNC